MTIADLILAFLSALIPGVVGVACGYGLGKQSAEINEQRRRDAEWDAQHSK